MKVKYLQKYSFTYITMGDMVGASRRRPGDQRNDSLGLAVAMLKADFSPLNGQELGELKEVFGKLPKAVMDEVELFDDTVVKWAQMRHEFKLALRAVAHKRDGFKFNHMMYPNTFRGLEADINPTYYEKKMSRIPSDGQIAENFGLRFLKETGLLLSG